MKLIVQMLIQTWSQEEGLWIVAQTRKVTSKFILVNMQKNTRTLYVHIVFESVEFLFYATLPVIKSPSGIQAIPAVSPGYPFRNKFNFNVFMDYKHIGSRAK